MTTPVGRVTIYWSSVSGNLQIKRAQGHIFDTFQAYRIPHENVDVAAPENTPQKEALREQSPIKLALPQIWVDGEYRAGYTGFQEAVENEVLVDLLKPAREGEEGPLH